MFKKSSRTFWISLSYYICTFLASVLGSIWVHRLSFSDLKYPWRVLDSDLSSVYAIAQALNHSWIGSTNNALGAPFQADLSLSFLFEDLHLVVIRLLAHLSSSPFIAVNAFYLLTFGFSSVSFLFVAMRFGIQRLISMPLSLAYAWLPYHFYRMDIGHVSLAAYYMLPFGVLILHRLYNYLVFDLKSFLPSTVLKKILFILSIVLVGSSGTYYGLFFAILTCSFCIYVFPLARSDWAIRRWLVLIGVATGFIAAPIIRMFIARISGLESTVVRNPDESVKFGGTIARMLVPWGSWLPERLRPIVSSMEYEWNTTPLLGVFGVWALLFSSALLILRRDSEQSTESRLLSYLFFWSLLFYTTGGLGFVFAHGIEPSFRAWNRLSIVILTLSLLSLGLLLSRCKFPTYLTSLSLLVATIGTQILPLSSMGIGSEPDAVSKAAYTQLLADANRIQQTVEPDCSILQLPIMLFPEGGQVEGVGNGEHLWMPLLTKQLRWSYGSAKGTADGKFWATYVGASPLLPIEKARELNFCAVLVNLTSNLNRDEIVGLLGEPVFENPSTGNSFFLIRK